MADVKVSGLPPIDNSSDVNPLLDEMIINAGGSTETSRIKVSLLQSIFGIGGGTDSSGVPRHYWQLNQNGSSVTVPSSWSASYGSATEYSVLNESPKEINFVKGAVGGYLFYSMPINLSMVGVDANKINESLQFDRYQSFTHKGYGVVQASVTEPVEFVGSNQSDKRTTGFNYKMNATAGILSSYNSAAGQNGNVGDAKLYSRLDYVRFPQSVIDAGSFNIAMSIKIRRAAFATINFNQCRFIFLPVFQEPSIMALDAMRASGESPFDVNADEDLNYDPVAEETAELSNQLKDAIQITQHQITGYMKEQQQKKDAGDSSIDLTAAEAILDRCWDLYSNKNNVSSVNDMKTDVLKLREDTIKEIGLDAWPWDTPSPGGYFQL